MASRKIKVRNIEIGGGAPVSVQSMTNTDTRDAKKTLWQISRFKDAGCDIVRLAVPDEEAARALYEIREGTDMPIVADIHFDYRLALIAADAGIDKIRINPGNIGSRERVRAVVRSCAERGIPIRIGVNGGSLEKDILKKYGKVCAEAIVESALGHIKMLEDEGFFDIAVSLKSSDVKTTIEAYRLMSRTRDYPLHLGVTEAGTYEMGIIKSSVGIGSLLCDGIGDTIRVSLTDDPVKEVYAGKNILRAVGLLHDRPQLVSCPTCGRCRIDMIPIAKAVGEALKEINAPIKVAVMGCAVNGPGEAREADVGVAGGSGSAVLFKHGEIIRKIPEDKILEELLKEIKAMI
ncbi:MAG: flavodoxin-dependent (E)-4-hydroxy-3-methylbut-2-enyl-diphosphate synthase [Clostridia bacterium]|nr:flavodoxin-dependent (E)-4-hydroxy-3-methylbut-2-enyl-diphosphate synthase [Clostridia bacterium]